MPVFLIGLLLGGISCGGSYLNTHDAWPSFGVGATAAALFWIFGAAFILVLGDDN